MNATQLRQYVREVLREELSHHQGTQAGPPPNPALPKTEVVSLQSDNDLMAFVQRIIKLARNSETRRALEQGQLRFRFATAGVSAPGATTVGCTSADRATATSGIGDTCIHDALVTERHVEMLDDETTQFRVARTVRFTPLALDRLRQRGITVMRMKS